MSGGAPSSVTSTQVQQVPEWLQPWATGFMTSAGANVAPGVASTIPGGSQFVNQTPFAPYPFPNKQTAPLTDLQQQGIGGIAAKGTTSQPIEDALAMLQKTMGQDAINNPLLAKYYMAAADPMVRSYQQATLPGINASALKSGAFGSSGHEQLVGESERILGESLDKLATGIYAPAWGAQETLKQNAAQQTPGLVAQSYLPSQMLTQAGTAEQTQMQQILNTAYENLYNMAGWPFQAQDIFANALKIAMGTNAGTLTNQIPVGGPFGPSRV